MAPSLCGFLTPPLWHIVMPIGWSRPHHQTKFELEAGQGEFRRLAVCGKTLPIQVLQNKPRDHPLGCDAVRSVSAFAP